MVSRTVSIVLLIISIVSLQFMNCTDNPVTADNSPAEQVPFVDTQPPVVSLIAPADAATVDGITVVAAEATDNVGIDHLEFYLDGSLMDNGVVETPPYEIRWDCSQLPDSSRCHLWVIAYDEEMNSAVTDTITVTVVHPATPPPEEDIEEPTVTLIRPTAGSVVSGSYTIVAQAADNVGIDRVEFFIDGSLPSNGTEYHAPYEFLWNTTELQNGSEHAIYARATDTSGNQSFSDTITVAVDNYQDPPPDTIPPVVSISTPADGVSVTGIVSINAEAFDNVAVERVEFFIDGRAPANSIQYTVPYEHTWDTSGLPDGGTHELQVRATDTSGNSSSSAVVQVTVNHESLPPEDSEPPVVSVIAPEDGSTVSGTVQIIAEASDNVIIDHVDFLIDGVLLEGSTEYNPPYECFWNTAALPGGSQHTIIARASDSSNNVGFSPELTVTVENSPPASTGILINEDLTDRQVFPANNWWNIDVSAAPVDNNSQAYINFIGASRSLHGDFGGTPWGIPSVTVPGDQPLKQVHFYSYGGESDAGAPGQPPGYPIPDEAYLSGGYIEGGQAGGGDYGDRHLLVIDRDKWLLFELFGTHWDASNQRWEAASGAVFNLATNDRRPEGWTSTDAAGLAVFPGLIRYDEVYGAGEIKHALRFTSRASNGYVWPASHAAGSTSGALPMGARLRLKASVDISGYHPATQKILRAMKTYGLILADNGSDMYIQGTMDDRWNMGIINGALQTLTAGDFEVIQLGWDPVNN